MRRYHTLDDFIASAIDRMYVITAFNVLLADGPLKLHEWQERMTNLRKRAAQHIGKTNTVRSVAIAGGSHATPKDPA